MQQVCNPFGLCHGAAMLTQGQYCTLHEARVSHRSFRQVVSQGAEDCAHKVPASVAALHDSF